MTTLCRWVGSKKDVIGQIFAHIPKAQGRFIVPFLGAGSDAFHAIENGYGSGGYTLNDTNPELIATYLALRDDIERVISLLRWYERSHDETVNNTSTNPRIFYLSVRAHSPDDLSRIERAARFLFLVGTSFNGLWRVNQSGKMNVPWGERIYRLTPEREAELRRISSLLNHVRCSMCHESPCSGAGSHWGDEIPSVSIGCGDFTTVIESAQSGDVVYCDPPYVPTSLTSSFASYGKKRFDLDEHRRLYVACLDAAKRGARVFVSNSDSPATRGIYKAPLQCSCGQTHGNIAHTITAPRRVAADGAKRGNVVELLIEIRT